MRGAERKPKSRHGPTVQGSGYEARCAGRGCNTTRHMNAEQSQMDLGELAQGRFDKEHHAFIAKRLAESPAGEIRLMESVCERENSYFAWHRSSTAIFMARISRPRDIGSSAFLPISTHRRLNPPRCRPRLRKPHFRIPRYRQRDSLQPLLT